MQADNTIQREMQIYMYSKPFHWPQLKTQSDATFFPFHTIQTMLGECVKHTLDKCPFNSSSVFPTSKLKQFGTDDFIEEAEDRLKKMHLV